MSNSTATNRPGSSPRPRYPPPGMAVVALAGERKKAKPSPAKEVGLTLSMKKSNLVENEDEVFDEMSKREMGWL